MSVIGWYCKAYEQNRFEPYSGWAAAKARYEASNGPIPESEVLFLHEDLALTVGAIREQNVVLSEVTDAWRAFCDHELNFTIPDYMTSRQGVETSPTA